jgi:hypothetical protein
MASLAFAPELCPNCGKEWPSRFGHHNCNYHRTYVHNHSIVVQPGDGIAESVERLTERHQAEACRIAESADLGGMESPYPDILADIDAAIGILKRHRAVIQSLSEHSHEWSDNDYCFICGADGRA